MPFDVYPIMDKKFCVVENYSNGVQRKTCPGGICLTRRMCHHSLFIWNGMQSSG